MHYPFSFRTVSVLPNAVLMSRPQATSMATAIIGGLPRVGHSRTYSLDGKKKLAAHLVWEAELWHIIHATHTHTPTTTTVLGC
jgi:hypothetical protein